MHAETWQRIQRLRWKESKVIRKVAPYGDCLFVSILVLLDPLGLLNPSATKSVRANENRAGRQLRFIIYYYICDNLERFRLMFEWMSDTEWNASLEELRTPGRYKEVQTELMLLVVSEIYGVHINVLDCCSSSDEPLSYSCKDLSADRPTIELLHQFLDNPKQSEHFDAVMPLPWVD